MSITDGPFAETKEQLGGFYLIEARDLNDAIQVAAKIPSARTGMHRGAADPGADVDVPRAPSMTDDAAIAGVARRWTPSTGPTRAACWPR